MGIENPVHLLFLAAVALLVLGPKRLPELARSLGRGIRELREAMSNESAAGSVRAPEHDPTPAEHDPTPAEHDPTPAEQVDPAEPVRSRDAPDRRPL
jgi:TatA/E family protein of Tat protein translocase